MGCGMAVDIAKGVDVYVTESGADFPAIPSPLRLWCSFYSRLTTTLSSDSIARLSYRPCFPMRQCDV